MTFAQAFEEHRTWRVIQFMDGIPYRFNPHFTHTSHPDGSHTLYVDVSKDMAEVLAPHLIKFLKPMGRRMQYTHESGRMIVHISRPGEFPPSGPSLSFYKQWDNFIVQPDAFRFLNIDV